MFRRLTRTDQLLVRLDEVLRAAFGSGAAAGRPSPAKDVAQQPLNDQERRHAAGLMRVNHTGEVCAQALYVGQAMVARSPEVVQALRSAAAEEKDHLNWCRERLDALEAGPSRLDPLWFGGSLALGVAAGLVGDRFSLGFVRETERQVEAHLEGHLERLPEGDLASRAVVAEMAMDEARHGEEAGAHGAIELPGVVRRAMALEARVMTTLAYFV